MTERITETITFHFDNAEQQRRFHERLNGEAARSASEQPCCEAVITNPTPPATGEVGELIERLLIPIDVGQIRIEPTIAAREAADALSRLLSERDEAREEEREACAKLVEANTDFMMLQDFGMQQTCTQLRTNLAAEIRARSALPDSGGEK